MATSLSTLGALKKKGLPIRISRNRYADTSTSRVLRMFRSTDVVLLAGWRGRQ